MIMPIRTFSIVCLLVAVAMTSITRAADDVRRKDPLALISQMRAKQLTSLLGLSEEQHKKVLDLYDEEAKKLGAIQAENITNLNERFAKQDAVRKETEQKLPPLLTEEQKAKYAAMKAKSGKKKASASPEKK
jgi:hypothetical protein